MRNAIFDIVLVFFFVPTRSSHQGSSNLKHIYAKRYGIKHKCDVLEKSCIISISFAIKTVKCSYIELKMVGMLSLISHVTSSKEVKTPQRTTQQIVAKNQLK